MDIDTAIRVFMQSRCAMNVSDRTLGGYDIFLNTVKRIGIEKGLEDISEYDEIFIRECIIMHKNKNQSTYTLNFHWRMFKTFFTFLFDNRYIEFNPITLVIRPQIKQRLPRVFTPNEISKMMNLFSGHDFESIRNRTLIYTLFSTGMRQMEFMNLMLNDLDTCQLQIYVIGKGNKERHIPIGKQLQNFLKVYLRQREDHLYKKCDGKFSPYVFIHGDGGQLTEWDVRKMFYKIRKDCKMSGRKVSPHTWRHTFATNYVRNGGDLRSLQLILGHSSLKTTEMYLTLSSETLREQNAKFNPLDNQRWKY